MEGGFLVKVDKYAIAPGSKVKLSKLDASDKSEFPDGKKASLERLTEIKTKFDELQELMYAEGKHKVLVVLQGMDTAGKDGTIRHVFEGVNPQGVRVASFKKPSDEDCKHDYLWRIHQHTPRYGETVIFNRSHYEDVLVVRVHDIFPRKVWSKRYDHINDFERMLTDEGVTILKFFLYIDKDEQKRRLEARIDDPTKHWKLSASDLPERQLWDKYIEAYEAAISKTSTAWAPWYVIPANHKWYRNVLISEIMLDTLKGFKMKYPEPSVDVSTLKVE